MGSELKNVNLKINPDLWQKAKIEAVRQGVKLRDYVTAALTLKLEQDKSK